MQVEQFISSQPIDRQNVLSAIHRIITQHDKTVQPIVEKMMGKEMIVYKAKGMMKYALANTQKHMSLHVLPMYMQEPIHTKYQSLLPDTKFQKGCINFNGEADFPIEVVEQLINDCAPIDLVQMREDQLKAKKMKK